MAQFNETDKNQFLYPRTRYHGKFRPENLVFNTNLQYFAQRVSYISGLETSGKLSLEEAYQQLDVLWQQLERSYKQLGVGENPFKGNSETGLG